MARVKIVGVEALVKGLNDRTKLEDVKKIVKHDTATLEARMKRQTTASFVKGYSTGDTRDSIHLSIKDGGLTGEVRPETNYSPYVEYGTRFMKAEPFVRPAFRTTAKEFKDHMDKLTR